MRRETRGEGERAGRRPPLSGARNAPTATARRRGTQTRARAGYVPVRDALDDLAPCRQEPGLLPAVEHGDRDLRARHGSGGCEGRRGRSDGDDRWQRLGPAFERAPSSARRFVPTSGARPPHLLLDVGGCAGLRAPDRKGGRLPRRRRRRRRQRASGHRRGASGREGAKRARAESGARRASARQRNGAARRGRPCLRGSSPAGHPARFAAG